MLTARKGAHPAAEGDKSRGEVREPMVALDSATGVWSGMSVKMIARMCQVFSAFLTSVQWLRLRIEHCGRKGKVA